MSSFDPYPLRPGLLCSLTDGPFALSLAAWEDSDLFPAPDRATHFGCVLDGPAELACPAGTFALRAGMVFAVPGDGKVRVGGGRGVLITQRDFLGVFALSGPLEEEGRLRYIDGCTDSLVIPPPLLGDPCLNLLHLPPGTRQSRHTHPSPRLGVILSGRGTCVTPDAEYALEPGLCFVIHTDAPHSFHTAGEALRVLAFHPDSDFGPTHENHPMVNRTILPTRGFD